MKIKTIGILILAAFFVAAVVTANIQAKRIKALKSDNARLDNNNYQLMAENRTQTNLFLMQKEVMGKLKAERDSLSKALKIRPKQIEKIIYIDNSTHDTIKINVPVVISGLDKWKITDGNECFKWAANALKQGDSLKVERTLFEYDNRITQTFYRERPHKFLFIKYGKWINKQRIEATCGDTKIQTFNFIK